MKRLILVVYLLITLGCDKKYLEAKPDRNLLVPVHLEDFQAILDNTADMNNSTYLNFVGADDYLTTNSGYQSASYLMQNAYLWKADIYQNSQTGDPVGDWSSCYKQVFNANVVLDGIDKLGGTADAKLAGVKGTALFFRAMAYFNLAQLFCKAYTTQGAANDAGIPIRLTADVNPRPARGTLTDTYRQIISDLESSLVIIAGNSNFKSRPSKLAVRALLARVYLAMGNYEQALFYAEAVLAESNSLLDYNTINATLARPFPAALPNGNAEVLFYSAMPSLAFLTSQQNSIHPEIYNAYSENDLRKQVFFIDRGNGIINFKGHYTGNVLLFAGLAIDEIYLTKSECLERLGRGAEAIACLNQLLIKRMKTGTYVAQVSTGSNLQLILTERRKELLYRNLRWMDLKRLNLEEATALVLTRTVNGVSYKLVPNSGLWVLPIPDNELIAGAVEQNIR
ncbi:MAG: RagB/SusD family nutrient uptake outer membrane protein [Sphingobacteriales bacterium]|nr:MAG: RagB/SusD family nutrient uptake outer membrane protein [Sphingobacteriales bacterium]